jgi:hypothetical protein
VDGIGEKSCYCSSSTVSVKLDLSPRVLPTDVLNLFVSLHESSGIGPVGESDEGAVDEVPGARGVCLPEYDAN